MAEYRGLGALDQLTFQIGLPSRSSTERRLVRVAGLQPANSPFEAEDDNNFTTDAEMVGRHGAAPYSAV